MLYGTDSRPLPPSDIERRVKQIDPALGLRWEANGVGGPGWWVIYRWPQDDARRRMIVAGQMSPDDDFDLYAQLPADCPVEQAYGFIVNAFRTSGTADAKRLLDRVGEYNRQVSEAQWAPVLAEAQEMIEHNAGKLFGEAKVVSRRQVPKARRGRTAKEG